ncbi:enoyl-CoA hydratase/isomerase family protein [Halosolutus amylolyticus]|uniref:Enoyl-CoA hydratase/isomerase family protein n=1 Tax=Halosolutus amylolyticus TaxID=2932267 RepID=A0ABD5PIK5_9EURY|nr:enoyl-CoA hydratase-related protein [Halosolutus amylolyticus]
MSESNTVSFELSEGIARIELNRPEKYNAYVPSMGDEILTALDEVQERDDVRCIVLEGRGEAFSAGGDIDGMKERVGTDVQVMEQAERLSSGANRVVTRLFRASVPTVAKIDGLAVGAGASLALACDLLLASETARIGFGFRQVGLTVDTGVSYFLPRLVGSNVAKELVYTGELVDADRGADIGIFNHVFADEEFDENAEEIIETIADGPTRALRQSKRLIDDAQHLPFESVLDNEAIAQGAMMGTPEHEEGVRSFLEDREPQFRDL